MLRSHYEELPYGFKPVCHQVPIKALQQIGRNTCWRGSILIVEVSYRRKAPPSILWCQEQEDHSFHPQMDPLKACWRSKLYCWKWIPSVWFFNFWCNVITLKASVVKSTHRIGNGEHVFPPWLDQYNYRLLNHHFFLLNLNTFLDMNYKNQMSWFQTLTFQEDVIPPTIISHLWFGVWMSFRFIVGKISHVRKN